MAATCTKALKVKAVALAALRTHAGCHCPMDSLSPGSDEQPTSRDLLQPGHQVAYLMLAPSELHNDL